MSVLRLDLHVHTRASHDCLSEYRDVVSIARARGLHRIAVTDHNEIEGAFCARDLAPELVIVGEEVKTAEGADLSGLFLESKVPKGLSARETALAIREQGGLVYVPHPFAGSKGLGQETLDEIAECVDIVEVFNARVHRPELNRRAQSWAEQRGLPGGAGSDAHTLNEIGRGVVEVPEYVDRSGFAAALSGGRVTGTSSGRLVHLASTWAKVARKFA